jgi:hypothetical protein
MQSLSAVQLVAQMLPLQLTYGEQLMDMPGVQVPVPLQVPATLAMPPEHVAMPQAVPLVASTQLPAPSQVPVSPHGGFAAH